MSNYIVLFENLDNKIQLESIRRSLYEYLASAYNFITSNI